MRNTTEYSRKCQDLPAKHDFKLNPKLKSLKTWWSAKSVTQVTKPTTILRTYRRNLLAELGSDTDADEDTRNRKTKKAKASNVL